MWVWTERPDPEAPWTGRRIHEMRRETSGPAVASLSQRGTKRRWRATGTTGCLFVEWDDLEQAKADVEEDAALFPRGP